MSSYSPGEVAFKLSFELSPIILTGGVAAAIPGGMLPIISITQALDFVDGLLGGGQDIDLNNFFATFHPLPGAKLISQQIGSYPFANQAVAANAVIRQPLPVPVRMICPARGSGGVALKTATMLALQATLAQHNAAGGSYTIATPSYFFTNCVMLDMTDISTARGPQPQETWQLDFVQPLLTLQAAQAAQNSLMQKISAGLPLNGVSSWSGLAPTVGNPQSLGGIGTIPAISGGPAGALSVTPLDQGAGPQ